MVKKKAKSSKSAKRRGSWQMEDVQVHTGLPPQVDGQLRCFCRLTIDQIHWHSSNPPNEAHVRVKWWGEDGDGALFRPLNVKKGDKGPAKTTARYPVRSGPRQFASYLIDMGSLAVEILSGPMMIPVGQAEITQIGLLSNVRPIDGLYPVFSPREEKLAEIHVSLILESLMASYDSTGSIPTTDISMETQATQESMYPKRVQPIPHSQAPQKPVDDPFISPASHQNGLQNGYADRAEDLRKQLNYSLQETEERQLSGIQSGSTVAITTNGDVVTTNLGQDQPSTHNFAAGRHSQSDLLSVLLDRGNKLRDQMIISAVDEGAPQTSVKQTYLPRGDEELRTSFSGMSERRSSVGSLLKEILKAERGTADVSQTDYDPVDLLFDNQLTDNLQILKMMGGSPRSSVSQDLDLMSDPGDPVRSESVLQELFYKNLDSDVSGVSELSGDENPLPFKQQNGELHTSMEDPANARPPSRRSSVSSLTLEFPEPEEVEVKKKKKKREEVPLKVPKRRSRVKTKVKGSKKRRRSRSSARSSASEASDSELMTARSEVSQVSFDMPASDLDEPEEDKPVRRKRSDGLSVERLTLLGRVHVARVVVDALHLAGAQDLNSSTRRGKAGGKPPKPSPKAKKSVTYFIEYQFPVVATSRDKYSPNAMATEVMRVASKNVKDGVVSFNHRSVFPIMFDGSAVEKWWKSALIFKLYSRTAGQKVPTLVGSCGIPLKSILRSDNLQVGRELEIRESGRNSSINSSLRGSLDTFYGSLQVSIELASDSKDFSSALARAKLAEMSGKAKFVPIPQTVPPPPPPPVQLDKPPLPPDFIPSAQNTQLSSTVLPHYTSHTSAETQTASLGAQLSAPGLPKPPSVEPYHVASHANAEAMTLHTLLLIPEGHNISIQGIPSLSSIKRHPVFPPQPHALYTEGMKARDMNTRNTYLVCRMFWCNDAVHSSVCWGTFEPQFNFAQIAPVLLSGSLLERMRNNFMVVEVWDKKTSAENDKLIGIVKLSLHQFYMSFRDSKISNALLKSQYPVISVDNYLPIVDPMSGTQFGQIKVLLAMGSGEQVTELQRLKLDGPIARPPDRPQHFLEREDMARPNSHVYSHPSADNSVEHIFEVVIEGIRGLSLFDNMIWGEADCFIQYHFPVQPPSGQPGTSPAKNGIPSMKSFRTATTLCIPDPTFNDITRHRIVLAQATPVQRELLTACAGAGGGSGGVPFEVWCRYYHPNIRDQCIAKASLPLAKLCAMVTMQKRGEPSVQSFGLPLKQVATDTELSDTGARSQMKESGLMDVTIHYKTHTLQSEQNQAANKNLLGTQICISVGVIRASGLKAAAETIARLDSGMQYPAEVGVNTYVKIRMSFLSKEDERMTRTIARTFAPEFSHHMDFPCPLLWTEADNDALALAEILETAEVTLEMWHQVPGLSSDLDRQIAQQTTSEVQGRRLVEKTQDVLLGTTTLSLATLLTNRTGISGWFAVNLPQIGWQQDVSQTQDEEDRTVPCNQGLERVVGGVELAIKFAHHNDRDRVIHAARGVGWSPVDLDVEDEEDWQSDDEGCGRYQQITICMDQVSFPLQNALIAGQSNLDKTARCYIRYKVYDKSAVVSKSVKCRILDTGYILSNCDHKHEFNIPISSPFKWYLREEKLEVQVWVSYGKKDSNQKSQHRDKLIGTTYIELDALNDERRRQHRISGMFPLFKPGAASLGGAFLRAHVTAKPQFGNVAKQSDDEADEKLSEDEVDEEYDSNDSFHQLMAKKKPKSSTDVQHLERVEEDSVVPHFPVVVSVERAMHLPLISDKNRSEEYLPNTYVSYQTSESASPAYTQVFYNSDNPVWDDQQETRLSTELLYQETKNLVFKVWHKPQSATKDPDKSADRVLGFVSVDLTPLTSGLLQICGWYNVMDFHGQCRGQIKVNIVPQDDVTRYVQGMPGQPVVMSFYNQPSSLPFTINSSVHNTMPSEQPMSLPTDLRPFSSNLPNFDQVREHQEQLQHQLSENIRQFLRNHEMSSQDSPEESPRPEVSPHWQPPSLNEIRVDDSAACSRSIMFSSLRKQMQDLDDITSKLKLKLVSPPSVTNSSLHRGRSELRDTDHMTSAPIQSIISPLSSLQLTSTLRANDSELLLTGSNEGESSRTAVDSGAFSVTQSSEKYQDALDSQRSSERMDTLRMGITPRDFDNTGQDGPTPREAHKSSGSTPRDAHNFSDTGIHMGYTPRDDTSVSTGGFNIVNTPRDLMDATTPRGLTLSQDNNANARDMHVSGSSSASLGFVYQGELSQGSSTGYRNGAPARITSTVTQDGNVQEMSVIQEFTENEEDAGSNNGEEDEKYYQEYCDILDEQENEDESGNEEENVVVPRTLNDVSGKFGGIPGHSVYMDSNGHRSPREFVRNGQTMSFDIRASDSRELSRTKFDRQEADDLLDLSDSESLPDQQLSPHLQLTERPSFIEKDSWFSDEDRDQKDQHVSRSDAAEGTHGDSYSPYRVNGDVAHRDLLKDVELESVNSGSHNTQNSGSRQSSRVSSAGSDRLSAKNSSGRSRGSETNYFEDQVPPSSSVPKSPKEVFSEVVTELEDFFSDPVRPQTRMEGQRSMSPSYGSRSRSRSPKMLNERVNFESSESFGDPDNVTTNMNGYSSLPNGETHDLPNGFQEPSSMPNFFLPSQHLAESMQALQQATSGFPSSSQQHIDPERQSAKIQATSDLMEKLTSNNHKVKFSSIHTKGRQPPTAAETKRIAKIFSEKFSSKD